MKSLQSIITAAALCSLALCTVSTAQISGTAGGEGTGSSNNPAVFATNPQNVGVNAHTAAAGANSLPTVVVALIAAAFIGGAVYMTLTHKAANH
jgi:hypothetical protein